MLNSRERSSTVIIPPLKERERREELRSHASSLPSPTTLASSVYFETIVFVCPRAVFCVVLCRVWLDLCHVPSAYVICRIYIYDASKIKSRYAIRCPLRQPLSVSPPCSFPEDSLVSMSACDAGLACLLVTDGPHAERLLVSLHIWLIPRECLLPLGMRRMDPPLFYRQPAL